MPKSYGRIGCWYVPIDDEHCVTFVVDYLPLTGDQAREYQERQRQAKSLVTMSPNEWRKRFCKAGCELKTWISR